MLFLFTYIVYLRGITCQTLSWICLHAPIHYVDKIGRTILVCRHGRTRSPRGVQRDASDWIKSSRLQNYMFPSTHAIDSWVLLQCFRTKPTPTRVRVPKTVLYRPLTPEICTRSWIADSGPRTSDFPIKSPSYTIFRKGQVALHVNSLFRRRCATIWWRRAIWLWPLCPKSPSVRGFVASLPVHLLFKYV